MSSRRVRPSILQPARQPSQSPATELRDRFRQHMAVASALKRHIGFPTPTSLMPANGGAMLRVTHRDVHKERGRDYGRQVIVEPRLVADGFEPERNRFRGATKD